LPSTGSGADQDLGARVAEDCGFEVDLEGLVRSPYLLATLGDAAGGGALAHFGRLLAERLAARQGGRANAEDDGQG
jgi:hypothetical protein